MNIYQTTIYIGDKPFFMGVDEYATRKGSDTPLKPKWNDIKFEILIALKTLFASDSDFDANSKSLCEASEAPKFELHLQAGGNSFWFEYNNPFYQGK